MPDPTFSPFSVPLDEISLDDLVTLRAVSEGWYVEYKSELTSQRAIAKSISAFANTYGGWVFFGISEDSSGQRIAAGYPGISASDAPMAETKIRQAVSTHMSPAAFFRSRVLIGPSSELGLPNDRAIVVVLVARSLDAPHVHGDGRIYRRVADESDPRPETDRHLLDILWSRRRDVRQTIANRLREEPMISEGEEDVTYLDLFITPDAYGEYAARGMINFDDFVELMRDETPGSGGIPFDNFFTYPSGYLARQIKDNEHQRLVVTWRQEFAGECHVTVPLNSAHLSGIGAVHVFLSPYDHGPEFSDLLSSYNFRGGMLVDFSQVFAALWGIFQRYSIICERLGIGYPIYAKARLYNMWRRAPFLDLSEYIDFVRTHRLPLVQDNVIYAPAGVTPESFLCLDRSANHDVSDSTNSALDAGVMLALTAQAAGIPFQRIINAENGLERLMHMSHRRSKARQGEQDNAS